MKRILLLVDSLISGGAQRQIVGLAKLLHDNKYQVQIVYYHKIEFYKPFLDSNDVPNKFLVGATGYLNRIFRIRKAIKKFEPDVVISYLDTPNIIACLLKASGMNFKLVASERNTTQVLTLREKIKFFMMRWADAVVPNSYSQEKFIFEHYPKLVGKMTTITNFVDTDSFVPSQNSPSSLCRIVTVGRVTEQKNTLKFLDALRQLKNDGLAFHVDWYGYSDPQYMAQCEGYIKENNLSNVFTFHEPSTDIVSIYQECDVFVLPSVYEGFPNVVCEAMSCGKPILCSDICDNPMIVADGENGYLFDPEDVSDMVEKIKAFIALSLDEKILKGEKSRQIAIEKFSSENFIKKYIDLIEN